MKSQDRSWKMVVRQKGKCSLEGTPSSGGSGDRFEWLKVFQSKYSKNFGRRGCCIRFK
jgi:hypothetical protein